MSFSSLRRPEAGIDRLKIGRLDRHKTRYRQSLVAPRSMVAGCVLMVAEVLHRFHSLCLHRRCPFGVFRACSAFFMSLGGVVGLRRSLVRLYGQPLLLMSHADGADEFLSIYFTHCRPDEDDGQRLDVQDEMSISGLVWSGVSVGPAIDSDGACTSTTRVIAGLDERAQSAWQTARNIGSCTAKLRLPWSRGHTGRMNFTGNSRWSVVCSYCITS